MQVKTLLPRWAPRAWLRPTVVVVLPSPSGVGVMAVTSMYLPCLRLLEPVAHVEVDLGLVAAEQLQLARLEARLLGDLEDGPQLGGLGDVDVARHGALDLDGHQPGSPASRSGTIARGARAGRGPIYLYVRGVAALRGRGRSARWNDGPECAAGGADAPGALGALRCPNSAYSGELTCLHGPSSFTCSPRTFLGRGRSLKTEVGECGTRVAPFDRQRTQKRSREGTPILSFCDSDDHVVRSMS